MSCFCGIKLTTLEELDAGWYSGTGKLKKKKKKLKKKKKKKNKKIKFLNNDNDNNKVGEPGTTKTADKTN